jgi:predicted DNA binding protein
VNPAHLFLGTYADNSRDCVAKGRFVPVPNSSKSQGSAHGHAKLTENDVRAIRTAYANGASLSELSGRFSISKTTVHNIKERRTWRHI